MTDTTAALESASEIEDCTVELGQQFRCVHALLLESRGPITPEEAAEVIRRAGEMAVLAGRIRQDCLAVQAHMRSVPVVVPARHPDQSAFRLGCAPDESGAARVGVPESMPVPQSHYCDSGNCKTCGDGTGDGGEQT